MIVHDKIEQGTPEWKALRLGRFGSTDAQAVANNGAGLETLIWKKVAERLTGQFEDDYTNPDMERGNEQEALARASYEMQTGNKVTQVGYVELDEFVGGSPDGLVGEDGIVEIKCQKPSVFVKSKYTKKIDPKYAWQIQHLLYITGREWCDFVVFNENFEDVIIIRVNRDEEKIVKLSAGIVEGIASLKKILEVK